MPALKALYGQTPQVLSVLQGITATAWVQLQVSRSVQLIRIIPLLEVQLQLTVLVALREKTARQRLLLPYLLTALLEITVKEEEEQRILSNVMLGHTTLKQGEEKLVTACFVLKDSFVYREQQILLLAAFAIYAPLEVGL
jgi:hypothetical protein